MARPKKERKVTSKVKCRDFVPVGICLEYVNLEKDEFEALKLKDFDELDQKHAALRMKISQPTFHRVLLEARKKVSDALVNAKEIIIKS
jgi:predicted DNA-binding protein (UPF0251 family)